MVDGGQITLQGTVGIGTDSYIYLPILVYDTFNSR